MSEGDVQDLNVISPSIDGFLKYSIQYDLVEVFKLIDFIYPVRIKFVKIELILVAVL